MPALHNAGAMTDADALQTISSRLERGEISSAQFLEQLARFMTDHIECSRAGVWFFVDAPASRVLRCAAMHDAARDCMVGTRDIPNADVGPFFEALCRDGCIVAADARVHPALTDLLADYLVPLDIHSQLDICFSVNGVLLGIFSCEQVGTPKVWSQRHLQALRQIGSHASLSLMRAASSVIDTAPGALWDTTNPNRLATMPIPLGPQTPDSRVQNAGPDVVRTGLSARLPDIR
jgi:GAF domain-containing protein